jgi:hypothetical protein
VTILRSRCRFLALIADHGGSLKPQAGGGAVAKEGAQQGVLVIGVTNYDAEDGNTKLHQSQGETLACIVQFALVDVKVRRRYVKSGHPWEVYDALRALARLPIAHAWAMIGRVVAKTERDGLARCLVALLMVLAAGGVLGLATIFF